MDSHEGREAQIPTRRQYAVEHHDDRAGQTPEQSSEENPTPQERSLTTRIVLNLLFIVPVLALVLWMLFLPSSETQQSNAEASEQSAPLETAFDHLEVSGRVGATPVVTLKKPISLAGAKERVYEEGNGRVIQDDQPLLVAITAYDGNTGELLNPSGSAKLQVGFANKDHFDPALLKAVVGHSEGSRIVMVRRLRADKVAPEATSEFEIDVVDILPSIATGTENPEANGKPLTVNIADSGPRVEHSGQTPRDLTTQILVKGEGSQVTATDNIVAQFIMARWSDGVVKQSTWDAGIPQMIDMSTAMPGLVQALTDQRVGSRIAITIPPELATGEDTMTVVVDILASASPRHDEPKNAADSSESSSSK